METVKRKINALKDEIERKDEGKNSVVLQLVKMSSDVAILREKLKKEQAERERYENEANHQSRKVSTGY